jgi:hypothetical protein
MEIVIVDDSEHFLETARAVLETDGISVVGHRWAISLGRHQDAMG